MNQIIIKSYECSEDDIETKELKKKYISKEYISLDNDNINKIIDYISDNYLYGKSYMDNLRNNEYCEILRYHDKRNEYDFKHFYNLPHRYYSINNYKNNISYKFAILDNEKEYDIIPKSILPQFLVSHKKSGTNDDYIKYVNKFSEIFNISNEESINQINKRGLFIIN